MKDKSELNDWMRPSYKRSDFENLERGKYAKPSANRQTLMSPPSVKLDDVVEALESAGDEHDYYLDKRTGEIVLLTNEDMEAAEDDELSSEAPDWQRDSILKAREVLSNPDGFVPLPDQFHIHEYKMMEDFCLAFDDRRTSQDLLRLIKGSGAFRRFKNAINEMGIEEAWYEFKRIELEKIAIEWTEENGIAYSRNDNAIDVSEKSM